jgi:hypothetical protein
MLFCLGIVCGCTRTKNKRSEEGVATNSTVPIPQAPASALATQATTEAACRGTMSGSASGALTCESAALFFLPAYKDSALRGNTEVSLMSSARFHQGTLPPGVELVTWAGVFRGTLQPGTYTEKNLIHSNLETAAVDVAGHKRFSGLKSVKLVVRSISAVGVHDDLMLKNGPMRNDKIVGELDLVIGDASGQVVIQATLK